MDFSTDGTKMLYLNQTDTTTILRWHHISDFSTDQCERMFLEEPPPRLSA